MGLIERCQELFRTSDLYEVLGSSRSATDAELRKSYYKMSLKVHPDRAPEDPQATEKFQVLGKLYAVLSDKEQRAIYDEQGVVDDESDVLDQDRCWSDYWRLLFPEITVEDIVAHEQKYKGSEEERQELLALYVTHQGDMDNITLWHLHSTQEDEPRIRGIIQDAVQSGEVEAFPAFTQESEKKKKARKKRADKEREEAEELKKELGMGDQDHSLEMAIKRKQKSREQEMDSFLSNLEAKYCKKSGGKSQRGKKSKK